MMVTKLPNRARSRARKFLIGALVLALTLGVILVTTKALDRSLETTHSQLRSPKIATSVTFVVLADLHSCDYGEGQKELVDAVDTVHPDAVLMAGDVADDRLPFKKAQELCEVLASKYPCYYVTGNHEWWSKKAPEYKAQFAALGVTVLSGETVELTLNGQQIQLAGIDDPAGGRFEEQLAAVARQRDSAKFSILLSHRPERIARYEKAGFDLVVAGHAHGGQWRLPGFNRGLIAPNQGLLPKYVNGLYRAGDTTLLVTRGLARESTRIPRLYNRPELVVLSVAPGE